jgi:heat shock protein HslJ
MKLIRKLSSTFCLIILIAFGIIGLFGCSGTSIGVDVTLNDTVWILETYTINGHGHPVLWNTKITSYFSNAEMVVRGSGGLDTYSGTYRSTEAGGLTVTDLHSTSATGDKSVQKQEQDYLSLLGNASEFKVENSILTVTCSNGILVFKP